MLLALDIGNSAVKAGLFEDGTLTWQASFSSPRPSSTGPDNDAHWRDTFAPHLSDPEIDRVGLASVVPARTGRVVSAVQSLTDALVTRVRPEMELPLILDYDTPDTLGADRLAAAAAGWAHYGRARPQSVLVVDAGTAVNCEVIHRDGRYLGGTIGPGPALSREALRRGTAQLPEVPLSLPDRPVGRSTQTALQSGIVGGLLDSVRGTTDRLAQSLPDSPRLVLTGGWSTLLTRHLNAEAWHAPHLVLRGTRLLTSMNR
jgi:type III pantothenate kinase